MDVWPLKVILLKITTNIGNNGIKWVFFVFCQVQFIYSLNIKKKVFISYSLQTKQTNRVKKHAHNLQLCTTGSFNRGQLQLID